MLTGQSQWFPSSTLVLSLAALANAHFDIKYPGTRGRKEDTHSQMAGGCPLPFLTK